MEPTLAGKHLFLVEDDPLLQGLLAGKLAELKAKGLESHILGSGESALEEAAKATPDLVLLDLVLPGMTGFDFLEKFRAEPSHAKVPVVILSNLNADADKEHAKKLGVVAYLVKANFSLQEISGAVEKLLLGGTMTPTESETKAPDIEKTTHGTVVYL